MSLISYWFIFFFFITAAVYYILPKKIRYLALLAASLFFYVQGGFGQLPLLLIAGMTTYGSALCIQRIYGKDPANKNGARIPFWFGVAFLLLMLVTVKAGRAVMESLAGLLQGQGITMEIIIPLGISYYTFAAVGYLADVYWKKDSAERNPLKLLLYLCYFPQILQGPIPKHKKLASQLGEGHSFDYNRVCFGLQRALWGYFKKMVIADRLSLMTAHVFTNYQRYSGLVFVFGLMGAVFQLYCDFSGCMDIAIGISEVFGITLDENFRRPFFAVSAAEFWRRWHITLGTWFKDYVYLPLSIDPRLMKLAKYCKKKGWKRTSRNVLTVIPLAVVWILTGLWHGTGADYVVWGIYWGMLIILSSVLAPEIQKINRRLGLTKEKRWWHLLQQWRTFVLYMIGRLLTIPGNLLTSRWIGRRIFFWNPWVLSDGTLWNLGWDAKDMWVIILGLLLLWRVSCAQEQGLNIREEIAKWPLPFRWAVYFAGVFIVLIFGVYGKGVSAGSFAYMNY